MPIPKPTSNENEDNFISRCMSDDKMKEEYPDEDQRFAVCQNAWETKQEALNRILEMDVMYISLVDKGANQKDIIYMSKNMPLEFKNSPNKVFENIPKSFIEKNKYVKTIEIKKADKKEHVVYGIVYSPEEVDSQGDIASAKVIANMREEFMRNARNNNVDRQHNYIADEGFVIETWIEDESKGKRMFPDEKEGSWVVGIKILKETTWTAIEEGRVAGLSMAGYALLDDLSKTKNKSFFKNLFSGTSTEKEGKVLSAKNIKKIQDVINLLNSILGDEKMENKEKLETQEIIEETQEVETIEKSEETESTPQVVEENSEIVELKKMVKSLIETNEKLNKRIDSLENSSTGLQASEGQEENKTKTTWLSGLVPEHLRQ